METWAVLKRGHCKKRFQGPLLVNVTKLVVFSVLQYRTTKYSDLVETDIYLFYLLSFITFFLYLRLEKYILIPGKAYKNQKGK